MEPAAAAEVVEWTCKWGGKQIPLTFSPEQLNSQSVSDLKAILYSLTQVPPDRQKLIGLTVAGKQAPDAAALLSVLVKKNQFMMVGTPEAQAFVDPSEKDDLPEVLNDLDFDYSPTSDEVRVNPDHRRRLQRRIESTEVQLINPPREGKRLLVLDLDYTLFDFKSTAERMAELKRPFLDEFMTAAYQEYDIVIWSQTSWRWLEVKLTELGLLTHPHFKISFVLDRSSMFRVTSLGSNGEPREHEVKALELIWAKFPSFYGPHNSIHIDDLGRNFAMNPQSGLKISPYKNYITARNTDRELVYLAQYLALLVEERDFTKLQHGEWKAYLSKNMHRLAAAMTSSLSQMLPPS